MPSTVVISPPSACTAKTRQLRTACPSSMTVHAPQTPCSQPRCVPVSWQRSRRKSARVSRGSTAARLGSPLTVTSMLTSAIGCLLDGLLPGAGHHGRAHLLPVAGGAVQVGRDRVEFRDGGPPDLRRIDVAGGRAQGGCLGSGGAQRGRA